MSAGTKSYLITPSPESALAVDVQTRGLRKRKHLFFFESYRGDLEYDPEDPLTARISLEIDAASVCCRASSEKLWRAAKLTNVAHSVLKAYEQPTLAFASASATPKPLRGYIVEGDLRVGGVTRAIRANVVFGTPKNNRFLVEGDSTVRLSEFALLSPHMLMGLIRASDEVLLRAVLWCTEARTTSQSTTA